MALKFTRLTRPMIGNLRIGERITEHGISAERLKNGDVRYSVAVMVSGRRHHRVIGYESAGVTRTQAETFIARARGAADEDRLNLPRGRKLHLTFEAASKLYLKALKDAGGKDYTSNKQHLRLHLIPYLGSMRLDHISEFTLEKCRNEFRSKGLSESTINRVFATYRRMGRRLHKWKMIPAPMPMIQLTTERNRRTYVIDEEEEERLYEAALKDSNSYIWLFIKIGMATGLRHTEMLAARFDGLDTSRRRLRVRAKGGRRRQQPLTRGIAELLQRERGMASDRDGWIFPSKTSKSGHIRTMSAAFARVVVKAGLNPSVAVPHAMRHTAITRLAETGADIRTLQEFSGHETVQMVLRYTHAQDRAVNRALDAMEGRTVVEHPSARKPAKS